MKRTTDTDPLADLKASAAKLGEIRDELLKALARYEKPSEEDRQTAYTRLDHLLRSNLDDTDYEEYSGYLEELTKDTK